MTDTTPHLGLQEIIEGDAGAERLYNVSMRTLSALVQGSVLGELSTPPGSPNDGDRYIVTATATGAWASYEKSITMWDADANGWYFFTPVEGWRVWAADTDTWYMYNGTAWVADTVGKVATVTASTTQTQGQGALTARINIVLVCANANDTVTLPPAREGQRCTISNKGAQTVQVFPATGDQINSGAINGSTTVTAGSSLSLVAVNATNWYSFF
jgi:hypothetical protein